METLEFKKSRILPNLSLNDNKRLFLVMNAALIIGGFSLVSTFLFLLANLDKADEILWFCLPGFCFGIVTMILYGIGHQKLSHTDKQNNNHKLFSFRR